MSNVLDRVLLGVAALAVIGMGGLITANVLARLVGWNIPDSNIIVEELMLAAVLLPLSIATAQRAHVVVEFVSNWFPERVRSWLVVLGSFVGLLALAPLTYAGARAFMGEWGSGSFYFGDLGLPKWPGRLVYTLALAVCWLRLAMLMLGDIATIAKGGVVKDKEAH
ncbi:TRAP-type C4-dicarboxylate transport system, small permease component [Thalassovita autumnalis]|jgi:TRAP-type C4-dicarboxylate transport system permease small subunit|uniref:TRAP transporter small permease protein n=1 Tax=Thalassovita autumnalis TaxID=2072972 RepID=A0A0P1G934_9RHOB|nr:TRAP transporter small permease [Thalassovita autumnalis]CUH68812.1 TRAP-type C4-dicarboxylate transport system, small permease component [Thalassovita autumnalis]CUH71345.1 TRAP-type C4-dicarboxylate transport system, small permease component [Thalassovita autumnalis]